MAALTRYGDDEHEEPRLGTADSDAADAWYSERERQPATNTYVRYLFDSQLFNVPNNHQQCNFLLTYLHYERIYDVTYVVYGSGSANDNRVRGATGGSGGSWLRRAGGGSGSAAAAPRFKRHRWATTVSGKRAKRRFDSTFANGSGGGLVGLSDDEENEDEADVYRVERMLMRQKQQGTAAGANKRAPASVVDTPMFNTGHSAQLNQPITRHDVRDLMQSIRLSGEEDDWLDLKVQLCLPSILLYFKLQGSATRVPNVDYTVEISIRELQLLNSRETLGHKLATILAYVRRRFFNNPVPNMDKLTLLDESDAFDSAATAAAATGDQSTVNTQQRLEIGGGPYRKANMLKSTAAKPALPISANFTAPAPPDTFHLDLGSDYENRALQKRDENEATRNAYRSLFGGGTVEEVQSILDFHD
jgi:hypothetical protein